MTDSITEHHVFDHQPPGVEKRTLSLITDWEHDEPQYLVCDTCGVHWAIGPRIPIIPRHADT